MHVNAQARLIVSCSKISFLSRVWPIELTPLKWSIWISHAGSLPGPRGYRRVPIIARTSKLC